MSRKTMIMIGMGIGSCVGGYVPTLFGAHGFSMASLFGSTVGGLAGIYLAFKLTA